MQQQDHNETENHAAVDYFVHEGMMTRMEIAMDKLKESTADSMAKMNESNKRMHSAHRTACITLVIVAILFVVGFVVGYTINNNNWLHYVSQLQQQIVEVNNAMDTPEVR